MDLKKYGKAIIAILVVMCFYVLLVFIVAKSNDSSNTSEEDTKTTETEKNEQEEKEEQEKEKKLEEESITDSEGDYAVITENKTVLVYKDGKWYKNPDYKYTEKIFDVYVDNKSVGNYYFAYSDGWNLYDENRKFLDYSGNMIGINSTNEYTVVDYITGELDDNDKITITNFLNNKNLKFDYDDLNKSKYLIDVNRDGMRDTIYFVSNAFTDNESSYDKAFAFGFVNYNSSVETFYSNTTNVSNVLSICSPNLYSILSINSKYSLISSCEYYSNKSEITVYEYNDGKINSMVNLND